MTGLLPTFSASSPTTRILSCLVPYTHTHAYVHIHTCMHTQEHTWMYTYTHTYTHADSAGSRSRVLPHAVLSAWKAILPFFSSLSHLWRRSSSQISRLTSYAMLCIPSFSVQISNCTYHHRWPHLSSCMTSPLGCRQIDAGRISLLFGNVESGHTVILVHLLRRIKLRDCMKLGLRQPCTHQIKKSQSLKRGGKENNMEFLKGKRPRSPKEGQKINVLTLPVSVSQTQAQFPCWGAVTFQRVLLTSTSVCLSNISEGLFFASKWSLRHFYAKCLIDVD